MVNSSLLHGQAGVSASASLEGSDKAHSASGGTSARARPAYPKSLCWAREDAMGVAAAPPWPGSPSSIHDAAYLLTAAVRRPALWRRHRGAMGASRARHPPPRRHRLDRRPLVRLA